MKNRQHGFIVPLVIAIIALLAISGGVYVYTTKNKQVDLNTFIHSSGAFSFKYPSNLIAKEIEKDNTVSIQSVNASSSVANFVIVFFPEYLSKFKDASEIRKINGYKVYSVSYPNYPQLGTHYLIPLETIDNPSLFMEAGLSPNVVGFSQAQFDLIFNSLVIDKEKTDKLAEGFKTMAKTEGLEAKMKANLSSLRPASELYFDAKGGYANLCSPTGNSKEEVMVKSILKAMTDEIGKENLVCFAKKDSYASSVKLPLGTFWCADSTGYMNTISSMINGYSCK